MIKYFVLITALMTGLARADIKEQMTPVCVHPNQIQFIFLNDETQIATLGYFPYFHFENEPIFGIDFTETTQSTYDRWKAQCPNNWFLEAYVQHAKARTVLKVVDRFRGEQFAPGTYTGRTTGDMSDYQIFGWIFDMVMRFARTNEDPKLVHFLQYGNIDWKINFSMKMDGKGSYVDRKNKRIQINFLEFGAYYTTTEQKQAHMTVQRLLAHELMHAAHPDLPESKIIEKVNFVLKAAKFDDPDRMPLDETVEKEGDLVFALPRPVMSPGQKLMAYFGRPPAEFVQDPTMWVGAFFAAPSFGATAIRISHAATSLANPRVPMTSPTTTQVLPRTSSVTSIDSVAPSLARAPLAELEDLSSLSSIEAVSEGEAETTFTSLEETVDEIEVGAVGVGPMTMAERIEFVTKVDEDLAALDIPTSLKMQIQFRLSPTAHYLNQAPQIVRSFLRGDMDVMTLYRQMPA